MEEGFLISSAPGGAVVPAGTLLLAQALAVGIPSPRRSAHKISVHGGGRHCQEVLPGLQEGRRSKGYSQKLSDLRVFAIGEKHVAYSALGNCALSLVVCRRFRKCFWNCILWPV